MSRSRRRNQNEGSESDPNADLLARLAQVENENAALKRSYEMFKKLSTEQASEIQKIKKENQELKKDASRKFDPFADLVAANERERIAKLEEDCELYKKLFEEKEEQLLESKEKQSKLEDETAKILRRHSELRKTALREFKFVRRELTSAKAENDVLRLQNRSHADQMKINHSIYVKKYCYKKQVNETEAEKENKLRLQREAEERRFCSDEHGIVTKWTDRQYFRVFYGKDHAQTQTESIRSRSKGVATTDASWKKTHSELKQLQIAKAKEFYNEARKKSNVNSLHQVFTSEKSTQIQFSSPEEHQQNTAESCSEATALRKLLRLHAITTAECNVQSESRGDTKNPVGKEVEPERILVKVDKGIPQPYPEKIEGQQNRSNEAENVIFENTDNPASTVLPPEALRRTEQLTSSAHSSPAKSKILQKSTSKPSSSPLRLTSQAKQNAKKFLGLQGRTRKDRVETLPAFDPETFEFSEYPIHMEDSNSASVSCSTFGSSDLTFGETRDESRELTISALEEEVVILLTGESRKMSSDKSENDNEEPVFEKSLEDGEIEESLDDKPVDTEKEAGELDSTTDEEAESIAEIHHSQSYGNESNSKSSEYPLAQEISIKSAAMNETSIDELTNSTENTSEKDNKKDQALQTELNESQTSIEVEKTPKICLDSGQKEDNLQENASTTISKEQSSSRDGFEKRSNTPVDTLSNDTLSSIDSIDSQTYPDRDISVLEEKSELSLSSNSNSQLSNVLPEPSSLSGSSSSNASKETVVDRTVSLDPDSERTGESSKDSFGSNKSPVRGRSPIVIDCRTAPIPDDCLELTNDTQSCFSGASKETIPKQIAEANQQVVPPVATTPVSKEKNAPHYTTPDNSIEKPKPVGSAKRKSTTPIKMNISEFPAVKRKRMSEKRKRRSKSRQGHEPTKKLRKPSTETDEDTSRPKRPQRVSPKPLRKTKAEAVRPEAENTPPKKLLRQNGSKKKFDLSSNSNSPLFVPKSSNIEKRRVPFTTLSKVATSEEKLTSEDDGISYMRSDQLFQNTASRKPENRNCQSSVAGPGASEGFDPTTDDDAARSGFSPIQQKIRRVGFEETMKEIGLDLSLTTTHTHTGTHSKASTVEKPVTTPKNENQDQFFRNLGLELSASRSDGSTLVSSSVASKVSDPKMRLQARRNLNSDGFGPSKSRNEKIIAGVKKMPINEQREISQAAEIILYFMKKDNSFSEAVMMSGTDMLQNLPQHLEKVWDWTAKMAPHLGLLPAIASQQRAASPDSSPPGYSASSKESNFDENSISEFITQVDKII